MSGAHLVAHSFGAIAALMAAQHAPDLVQSIVLFEPACLSLARGGPAVEAHVRAVEPALHDAALADEDFLRVFFVSLGQAAPSVPLSAADQTTARLLRLQRGPWEAELDPMVISAHPTLVVTSGASPMSEEVARSLTALGADHALAPGTGHRPQDGKEANALLRRFWGTRPW